MEQLQSRGKDSSRERYKTVFKSASFDALRQKKLLETTADDFFAVFKDGKVSIVYFLKRLHNFALSLGWIALPVVAPTCGRSMKPKTGAASPPDRQQQSILALEEKPSGNCRFWNCYGKPAQPQGGRRRHDRRGC